MKNGKSVLVWVISIMLVCTGVFWLFSATDKVEEGSLEAGRQQLETALRRAAVACYAAEGIYPPELGYLETHYGVQIDREKYHVFYEIFAENLMPEITVTIAK